ncbi:MAG: WD40 repeat domain-containing protein [Armatimonadota bacterium]
MRRSCVLAMTVTVAVAMSGVVEAATDLFGDPLPEGAVQRLGSLRLRYGGVGDLDYLPDGRAVIASGVNIDIWDMSVGEKVGSHQVGPRGLTAIDVSSDGRTMLAGDNAGNVYEWDFEAAEATREWATGQGRLATVYYSTDETRALTCGVDPPTIKEWEIATGEELVAATSELHSARQAIYGPGDESAFIHGAAGSDSVVAQFDLSDGSLIRDFLQDYYTHTRSIALSPDGERLLVGSRTRATEWQVAPEHELLNTFRGHHGGAVTSVAYAPDPDQLLTGSRDGSIRLWDRLPDGGEVINRWFAHSGYVNYIVVSPDGNWVLSYGGGNMVVEYGLTDGEPRLEWDRHELGVQAVAIAPDGRAISGAADGTVRVWDALSGEQALLIEDATQGAWAVAASPDGERIAAGCKDGVVREFSASDGSLIRELHGHLGYIRAVEYMPQGASADSAPSLVSAAGDGTIRIWPRSGDEPLRVFEADLFGEDGHRGGVLSLAVSEDGAKLLSGGRDGTMRLWDLRAGAQEAIFRGHRGWVEAVAFTTDGEAVSGSRTGTLRRWDLGSGEVLAEMDHGATVYGLAISRDGGTIFAGGTDNAISAWTAEGEALSRMTGHEATVNGLALSSDGAYLVSASDDATLLVWKTPVR